MIQTVLGKINKEDMGITLPHEHIFIELTAFFEERPLADCKSPATAPVTMDKLGILSRDPYALRDNLRYDDFETQLKEISRFKVRGGQTVVDVTMPGIGRNPQLLKRVAEESGLHVVAGTGFYVSSTHPEEIAGMTTEEIAAIFVREIEEGMDGTDIKAGIIGEIGISEIFGDPERRVLEAAGIASIKTGKSVMVHINPWTENGLEAAEILLRTGVKPEKIAVCHIDVENREDYILKLLNMGVYIEFDNFGKEYYVERDARREGYGLFVQDTDRVRLVKKLIDMGFKKQILLSCDVCLKNLLRTYGGWGYDHILTNIVPMMEDEGITKEDIRDMLIINPAEYLEER
ncbi:MAG: hypothetical protein PUB07_07105 [Clostridia bacterium]|nr:hypothetical protein [Clostridia bacterium]